MFPIISYLCQNMVLRLGWRTSDLWPCWGASSTVANIVWQADKTDILSHAHLLLGQGTARPSRLGLHIAFHTRNNMHTYRGDR